MTVARKTHQPLPPWIAAPTVDEPSREIDELIREIEAAEPRRPAVFETYTPQRPATESPAEPPPPPKETEEAIVIDLRPRELATRGPAPDRSGESFGLGSSWGATWKWAAQGWVEDEGGRPQWRPVVTTTGDLPKWDVHTYLGIVAGEAAVGGVGDHDDLGDALEEARRRALDNLIEEAVNRGAHAVVGVRVSYTPAEGLVIVSAIGTAATLQDR